MKVCLLGNSHLAAIKHGWDQSDTADVEPTFLGAPGGRLNSLIVSDGKLHGSEELTETMLKTTGVAEGVLADFDAFVIVGLRFTSNHCARLFGTHRPWSPEAGAVAGDAFLVSEQCFLEAASSQLHNTIAMRLARRIRTGSAAPIVILPQPGPSDRVLEDDSEETELWRDLHRSGREGEIRDLFQRACDAVSSDVTVIDQPPSTVVHDLFTDRRYDSPNIKTNGEALEQGLIDPFHMNEAYGRLVVPQLLDQLTNRQ